MKGVLFFLHGISKGSNITIGIYKQACVHTHIKSSKKPKGSNTLHPEESKNERDCLPKVIQIKKKYLKTNVLKNEQA